MKGLLLRVGIDQTFGQYNAPINPLTNDYLYMPIPQGQGKDDPQQTFRQGMQTTYAQMDNHFSKFAERNAIQLAFPEHLRSIDCHLDPDFENLTYGDQATGRGCRVGELDAGDFIAFFASFRPVIPCDHVLVYALYGIFFIGEIQKAKDVLPDQWHVNAHTRIQKMNDEHLIVLADKSRSGRFRHAIPIGENRNGAYRVTNKILDAWGDIKVKDGFIQRSVCPPWFTKPEQFLKWLDFQQVKLINNNWG